MSNNQSNRSSKLIRNARNLGVSALIAASVGTYALYQRSATSAQELATLQPVAIVSTLTPLATATPSTGFQDGEYEGDAYNAGRWGTVQVSAVIQEGQLADFKILSYPHSRSTSQRISQVAIPYLMQEAVQAQSASVDLISGATYTSEAFIASLQSALDAASVAAAATDTVSPTPAASASL